MTDSSNFDDMEPRTEVLVPSNGAARDDEEESAMIYRVDDVFDAVMFANSHIFGVFTSE